MIAKAHMVDKSSGSGKGLPRVQFQHMQLSAGLPSNRGRRADTPREARLYSLGPPPLECAAEHHAPKFLLRADCLGPHPSESGISAALHVTHPHTMSC